jgi:hypothetical protein
VLYGAQRVFDEFTGCVEGSLGIALSEFSEQLVMRGDQVFRDRGIEAPLQADPDPIRRRSLFILWRSKAGSSSSTIPFPAMRAPQTSRQRPVYPAAVFGQQA